MTLSSADDFYFDGCNDGRAAAIEECAKIADGFAVAPREVTPETMARSIAAAIRALAARPKS